ncbi:hypothetical protein FHG87_017131 [Trinorchestia longiramus]|nr:hypothetical protein FHG87_017131 [Trinorchestia longiramus]
MVLLQVWTTAGSREMRIFVKKVEIMINNNPSNSMRSMAAELRVTVVLPWMKQVARDRPWVWQQGSAPCHVSNCSLACLGGALLRPRNQAPMTSEFEPNGLFLLGHFGESN